MNTLVRTSVATADRNAGIMRAVRHLGIAWIAILVVGLLMMALLPAGTTIGGVLLIGGTGFIVYSLVHLILAKARVLREREVLMWNGFVRLISWNPTEGLLILKNKNIDFVDDNPDDGGGIRIIYPLLGEEVALRIPLEIQTLPYADSEILTKEYIPMSIRGTIYWRICDLSQFYLNISKEIHTVDDTGAHSVQRFPKDPKLEVAEQWLLAMAEEKTRSIVSGIGTGLLIADQLSSDLSKALPESTTLVGAAPESAQEYRGATNSLAERIKADFGASARVYGLEIHEVRLQEVKLPPEIYAEAVAACKSAYLPLKARGEAIQRKLMLQAEADVIGKDAAGLKAVAGSIPPLAFQEFLAPLFLDFNRKRGLSSAADK